MGDVGCNCDLWRNPTGEFLKLWTESLPDIDLQMLASLIRRGQSRLDDFVAGFPFSANIRPAERGYCVCGRLLPGQRRICQILGRVSAWGSPDFFVEFGASQANSCLAHKWFLSAG